MTKPDLYEISEGLRVSGIDLPSFGAHVPRFTVELWRLLTNGRPISPEQVEKTLSSLGISREVLIQLQAGLEYDGQGNIVGAVGLSLNPASANRLQINGHTLYTWCAWDALFIPGLIGRTADVESRSPAGGESVHLTVAPDTVSELIPEQAVVSMLAPTEPFDHDVIMSFCHFVHFFTSRGDAEPWLAEHPGTFLLSVKEAFELGRLTNRATFGETNEAAA